MKEHTFTSIFNDVVGPVMRGPSSSHTAASHRIGVMARSLLGDVPAKAEVTFDPDGSYGRVYMQQGVDLALAAGLMNWSITDDRFSSALDHAAVEGLDITFTLSPLEDSYHPNAVDLYLQGEGGKTLKASARSVGGGLIEFTRVDGAAVILDGKEHVLLVFMERERSASLKELASGLEPLSIEEYGGSGSSGVVVCRSPSPLPREFIEAAGALEGVKYTRACPAVFFPRKGGFLFASTREMVSFARKEGLSLGEAAAAYESVLLGMTWEEVLSEMLRRYTVMRSSVEAGLGDEAVSMNLLDPSASGIMTAEREGRLPVGGMHTRAAARALAAMHTSSSSGVVCAAPTGGSAGVIPGVVMTLTEEKGLSPEETALVLFAAGAVGLVVARKATFAAEIAGCQVEIGAAGAMAAAAVVEYAGGSPGEALDSAAVSFQNTMGSVCDLVQGLCEIPCHTRNAAAASSAFVCADLVMGGYKNPVPLEETLDAVMAVGRAMPSELKVTARGGLAAAPSARALKPKKS